MLYNSLGGTPEPSCSIAAAATQPVTDGTLRCSKNPAGYITTYYETSNTHQIAQIAYPNNSNLANVYLLYDAYGRQATVQKGTGGPTVTTRYNALDRVTGIAYSDGTPTVSYGYDAAGKVKTMTEASGTTTYGHGLGRLTSVQSTAGGGAEQYTYDGVGNVLSHTDAGGTTTNTFDVDNLQTTETLPGGTVISFGYNKSCSAPTPTSTIHPGTRPGARTPSSPITRKVASATPPPSSTRRRRSRWRTSPTATARMRSA